MWTPVKTLSNILLMLLWMQNMAASVDASMGAFFNACFFLLLRFLLLMHTLDAEFELLFVFLMHSMMFICGAFFFLFDADFECGL